jgi:hypothetical protein
MALLIIGLTMQMDSMTHPPALLQIVREPLKPGSEAAFSAIEEDIARAAAAHGCPHPYLGTESLTGPKEAWWFNAYESPAEQKRVADAYAANAPLLAAMQTIGKPKASLTLAPIEVVATYRRDASAGAPWRPGQGRYLVIVAVPPGQPGSLPRGTVFGSPDGTRFVVIAFQARQQAEAAHASAGPNATLLAVRPSWSFPSPEWVAADKEFWRSSPAVKRQ